MCATMTARVFELALIVSTTLFELRLQLRLLRFELGAFFVRSGGGRIKRGTHVVEGQAQFCCFGSSAVGAAGRRRQCLRRLLGLHQREVQLLGDRGTLLDEVLHPNGQSHGLMGAAGEGRFGISHGGGQVALLAAA